MTAASCLLLVLAIPAAPQAGLSSTWLTGTALQKELQEPRDLALSEAPLRQALRELSLQRHVAVFIDRRIDPDRRLKLEIRDTPLGKALGELAKAHGLGLTFLGPVAYFGPLPATARLRTVVELCRDEVHKRPLFVSQKFLRARPIRWNDFDTPRELLAQLAAENNLTVVGLDQIPHDLWAAADLPPLSLIERLTLLVGQFDLTFTVEGAGDRIRLLPVPNDVALVRSYFVPGDPQQTAAGWSALVPGAKIKIVGSRIVVRGSVEAHEQIAALVHPAPSPKTAAARPARASRPHVEEKRFTVPKSRGRLEFLLTEYAKRLNVQLKIDRDALQRAGISLDQMVSFSVQDATLDDLFRAIAAPAGCACRHTGNIIEITVP
jgi:hypothetical protein